MGSEFFFEILDYGVLDFGVSPAVEFFMSLIFFRESFPMAGVDGAALRVDFLIEFPLGASICFF